jgi:hypothetical protein
MCTNLKTYMKYIVSIVYIIKNSKSEIILKISTWNESSDLVILSIYSVWGKIQESFKNLKYCWDTPCHLCVDSKGKREPASRFYWVAVLCFLKCQLHHLEGMLCIKVG